MLLSNTIIDVEYCYLGGFTPLNLVGTRETQDVFLGGGGLGGHYAREGIYCGPYYYVIF